jgi:hypothetical protein
MRVATFRQARPSVAATVPIMDVTPEDVSAELRRLPFKAEWGIEDIEHGIRNSMSTILRGAASAST